MLLVEVRRLDIAPTTDQFWTAVSRINGPEFMGVLYRAREAIFDTAGISFTIDLLNKFLQFDVTKSWSAADEGELFMGSGPVVGWLRVRPHFASCAPTTSTSWSSSTRRSRRSSRSAWRTAPAARRFEPIS